MGSRFVRIGTVACRRSSGGEEVSTPVALRTLGLLEGRADFWRRVQAAAGAINCWMRGNRA